MGFLLRTEVADYLMSLVTAWARMFSGEMQSETDSPSLVVFKDLCNFCKRKGVCTSSSR